MRPFHFFCISLLIVLGLPSSLDCQAKRVQRGVQAEPATGSATPIGPYYALVIGNNDYQYLDKLQTAVHDAEDVARVLREQYGFETKVILNATRIQTIDAFDEYRKLPENSSLLFYYAGHGYKDKQAHRAYWLPVDAERNHTSSWISAMEIIDGIRAIPSRHILVIADSCFSGDLTMRTPGSLLTRKQFNAMLAKALKLKSRHIMSSGGDEPVADAGAGGHSVFADALLRSLRDMPDDAFMAETLLIERVKPRVAGRAVQTPQYAIIRDSDADLGDFVFFRLKNAGSSPGGTDIRAVLAEAKRHYDAKEYEQALPLLRNASEAGQAEAAAYLGVMYARGLGGLPKDDVEAVSWLRKSADAGNGRGMADLGFMYANGLGGLPKDDARAVSWFRKSADAGDGRGMARLGVMYGDGRGGLAKDDAQAVSWYRKSADAGDGRGMVNLGIMYANGLGGLAKDETQAVRWFRKSAEAGDDLGMVRLGVMYEKGLGGLRMDKAQALTWYRKSADAGNEVAKQALKRLAP